MATLEDRIVRQEKLLEPQLNRLRDMKAVQSKQRRKDDTRRKILYGAAFLLSLDGLSETARTRKIAEVERQIKAPRDRKFLGLSESVEEAQKEMASRDTQHPGLPFDFGG
ncbi:hypothetical protein GCM10011360_16590 [Primorskyibacter flagellatus]|uniref:Uncharacterized protein n=2 Tax=Primorskyibacter flagellatus TaxID=1387277 RepID=A0A917A5M3_9RHOB|nr:hypothetical protein GCM10011360_16590 [Primorskyibacter flagellatus]